MQEMHRALLRASVALFIIVILLVISLLSGPSSEGVEFSKMCEVVFFDSLADLQLAYLFRCENGSQDKYGLWFCPVM